MRPEFWAGEAFAFAFAFLMVEDGEDDCDDAQVDSLGWMVEYHSRLTA